MRESDGLRIEIDKLKELRKETIQINYLENNGNCHNNGIEGTKNFIKEKFPVDLKKCDSPTSDKQKRKVLEGFRTRDMKSGRGEKFIAVGTDGSEIESEFESRKCSSRNEDFGFSGVFFEQDQVDILRGDMAHNDSVIPFRAFNRSDGSQSKITELETRISLAAAGTIEALSVLTCENSIQTRYETALSDKVRRSLLQYGRGNMDPIQWGKYRVFRGNYYVGRAAVSAVTVEV